MFERKDISQQLSRFINSETFKDFEDIMNDTATQKLIEIQSNPDVTNHAQMIADRKILNFYLNLSRDLKFRLMALEQAQKEDNLAKVEESQRISE